MFIVYFNSFFNTILNRIRSANYVWQRIIGNVNLLMNIFLYGRLHYSNNYDVPIRFR
jgi:hypothetical protein